MAIAADVRSIGVLETGTVILPRAALRLAFLLRRAA
jgi:hypothetical protein